MASRQPGDTTKIIPPPRRGPRWIDLALAAVAGSLVTVLVLALLFFATQGSRVLPSASSASPSATSSPSELATSSPAQTTRPTTAATTPPTDSPAPTPPPATTRAATAVPTLPA